VSSRRRRADTFAISKDITVNMKLMCQMEFDVTLLKDEARFLKFLDDEPCASVAALLTYMTIDNILIPRNPEEQEKLVSHLTNQVVVSFSDIIGIG